ncbi:MAG: hypothetical protein WCJ58_07800 [bacterium]
MSQINFNLNHVKTLDKLLLTIPGVKSGKMFGYPAYYCQGKLFACVYEVGVGVKIPETFAQQLLKRTYIVAFQPLGRPKMREWVQINHQNSSDYQKDLPIFKEAIRFAGK